MTTKSLKWTAALLALGLGAATAGAARAAEPTQQELMQQLNELKAKVAAMEQNQANALAKYDSRDVDATVAAVLRDADRHSLLIDGGGIVGGWDKTKMGFFLGSEDGSSYFHPGIIWQFRNVTSYREKAKNGGSDTQSGFENTRIKPLIDGTLFTKDFSYKFMMDFDRNTGSPIIQDAYVAYVFAHHSIMDGDLAVKFGQFKPQTFREEFMGDNFQLAAERSLANFLIGGTPIGPRVQGVSLLLTGPTSPLHAEVLFGDGDRSQNTDFRDQQPATGTPPVLPAATNWGAAGRVEYKFFGNWADQIDFTSHTAKSDFLAIGAGIDMSQQDNANSYRYTVDVQYKLMQRLSAFAGFYGTHFDFRNVPVGGNSDRNDYGGMAQVGFELSRQWEVFGRYSLVKFDKNFIAAGVDKQVHEITAGVNFYTGPDGSYGHHGKITIDVTYLPNGAPQFTQGGILNSINKRDELVLRGQFQLWI